MAAHQLFARRLDTMNGKGAAYASIALSISATMMVALLTTRLSAKLGEISYELERDMQEFRDMEKATE
ncbi:unnamed protein product [Nippostrongylus brasiliensis]|uniref:Col_cuticle_N domain-containing protein n=1 Tax=Nippostrongylus brasiliensis TaxID=27835 RepID=A0A0N4XWU5_NIPBR|nr:unnamed protein product [Nippostrongylus brasiliensis]